MKSGPVRGAARQFLVRTVVSGIALALSPFCACAEECIVLLHDVQPHTAAAIPGLLRELKARGYSIVQAVATDTETKPVAISSDAVASQTRLK